MASMRHCRLMAMPDRMVLGLKVVRVVRVKAEGSSSLLKQLCLHLVQNTFQTLAIGLHQTRLIDDTSWSCMSHGSIKYI